MPWRTTNIHSVLKGRVIAKVWETQDQPGYTSLKGNFTSKRKNLVRWFGYISGSTCYIGIPVSQIALFP